MRIKLKNKKRKKYKLFIIITIFIILLYNIFDYTNKVIKPKLFSYAELELKKISNLIINKAVTKHAITDMSVDKMFIITKNDNNEILTIDFNTVTLNKVLTQTTNSIQLSLKKLEDGIVDYELVNDNTKIKGELKNTNGVILEIPLGQVFDNFILNNLGPKIPVRLRLLGNIETNVRTEVKNYGINNAIIEVSMDIKVTEKMILPIMTKDISVTQSIPIAIKILNGTVPEFYSGQINEQSPTFSIPVE